MSFRKEYNVQKKRQRAIKQNCEVGGTFIYFHFWESHYEVCILTNSTKLRSQPEAFLVREKKCSHKFLPVMFLLSFSPCQEPHSKVWCLWVCFTASKFSCMQAKSLRLYPTLRKPHGPSPTRFLCPSDFPGKNTAVACHFLLEGIFLTQG